MTALAAVIHECRTTALEIHAWTAPPALTVHETAPLRDEKVQTRKRQRKDSRSRCRHSEAQRSWPIGPHAASVEGRSEPAAMQGRGYLPINDAAVIGGAPSKAVPPQSSRINGSHTPTRRICVLLQCCRNNGSISNTLTVGKHGRRLVRVPNVPNSSKNALEPAG